MAHCSKCGNDVGCGCNLVQGLCVSCYSKTVGEDGTPPPKRMKRERYVAPKQEAPPITEFEQILKTDGITREEKLKRINDILEQARKQYLT